MTLPIILEWSVHCFPGCPLNVLDRNQIFAFHICNDNVHSRDGSTCDLGHVLISTLHQHPNLVGDGKVPSKNVWSSTFAYKVWMRGWESTWHVWSSAFLKWWQQQNWEHQQLIFLLRQDIPICNEPLLVKIKIIMRSLCKKQKANPPFNVEPKKSEIPMRSHVSRVCIGLGIYASPPSFNVEFSWRTKKKMPRHFSPPPPSFNVNNKK